MLLRDAAGLLAIILLGLAACIAAGADSSHRSLEGTVVDAGGKPVAGAEVFFVATGVGIEVSTQGQSGPEGHFRLAVPEHWLDAPAGVHVETGVIAFKNAMGRSALGFKQSGVLPAAGMRLSLGAPPGAKAAIQVLDPSGKPVANAKVWVSALAADALYAGLAEKDARVIAGRSKEKLTATPLGYVIGRTQVPLPEPLRKKLSTTTDRNGNALVIGVKHSEIAGVDVLSENHGSQEISLSFADYTRLKLSGQTPLEEFPKSITLRPVGSLYGRLTADSGGAGGISLRILSAELPGPASGGSSSGGGPDARLSYSGRAEVTTDAEGRFSAPTLAVGTAIVQVRMPKGSPLNPVIPAQHPQIEPGKKAEMTIPLKRAVRATGIVRDAESGKPIPGLPLFVLSGNNWSPETLRTDDAGRYQCLVAPGQIVQLPHFPQGFMRVAGSPNSVAAFAEVPADKETHELPPLELSHTELPRETAAGTPAPKRPRETAAGTPAPKRPRDDSWRYRVLAGRVVDRQGKPVAGATVFQSLAGPEPKAAATDADGRFRLEGIWSGKSFVFASQQGFRLSGRAVEGLPDTIELVLARSTEPPRRILKTLPLVMPRQDRLALARKLLEPAVKKVQAAKDTESRVPFLQTIARVDPGRLLELLEAKPVQEAFLDQMLRRFAAIRLAKESPEEAQAIAESMSDPSFRSIVYVDFADASPSVERKLELLGQALVQARAIDGPPFRAYNLGQVGKRLLDLGRIEQATKVLREGQAIAKQLSLSEFAGYTRGALATELAPVDLDAALELVKGLTDPSEYNRHHGNIAHKIAGKKPAEAQRVLDMIRKGGDDRSAKDRYAVRVCYRMAPVDLSRARQIAARTDEPYLKAQAYGVMAQALATSQPAAALALLREAFGELERHVRSGKDAFNGMHNAASVAASLLSVAEKIDPNLVDEFLWQALAFQQPGPFETRGGIGADPQSEGFAHRADIRLAVMLARYDRDLAAELFEPAWTSAIRQKLAEWRDTLTGAALLKPKDAAAALEKLPDEASTVHSRCQLARALVWDDDDIWGRLQERLLGLWKVDDEDLGSVD